MESGETVFAQIIQNAPRYEFNRCVLRYRGNHWVKRFSCWTQFLCMVFAQLTSRKGLRDIETGLNAHHEKLYRAGFRGKVARSTLADANEQRDFRIYQDFGLLLIGIAQKLYQDEDLGLELAQSVYALDSTTIDLCLALFPWATFRETKAAVKVHTLLDLKGSIPVFLNITTGKVNDVNILDDLPVPAGAIVVMDRGYLDFKRWYALHTKAVFFVTRAKSNFKFRRRCSRSVDKSLGLRCDQTIKLVTKKSLEGYPDLLRRISYVDQETGKKYVFLTNNFDLPAKTIADIYKQRWQIELFFKWLKQHLRIKAFYGTSANAVKTQIWIDVSAYLLMAITKKRLKLDCSLYTFLNIVEVAIFEKKPIFQLVSGALKQDSPPPAGKQLNLFSY
ncbi:MAG: IS4 family transposase [Desulfuromonadales bacterium]|nr:MAG: IS4 family transposase [Desulfuromonadales bacterium]